MSTVYGVNKTKSLTPHGSNVLERGIFGGNVHVMIDQYECAALAAGSTIHVGQTLPAGARILEVIISSDNLANNTTLAVGDAEDTDRYITAIDHGAAAVTTRLNAVNGLGYVVDMTTAATPDNQILITTAAGEATGTINIVIIYAND